MKKMLITWIVIALLASAGSLVAHHSLAQFDTSTPVRVKGIVVVFERINPHSIIFLDQKKEDGQTQRWAVDGPGITQLDRFGVPKDMLKAGDVIEVCGFAAKESVQSQSQPRKSSSMPNMQGRILNGHVLVMPDGQKRFWSDYGQLDKCLGPGETRDSLIR